MKFTKSNVTVSAEVLKRKTGAEVIVPITLDDTAFTNGVCVAGTAINADGEKATTTEGVSDAVGILLNDVIKAENPNGALIKAFACINASNSTATSADKTALSNLIFE